MLRPLSLPTFPTLQLQQLITLTTMATAPGTSPAPSSSPFSLADPTNKVEIGSQPGTLWSLSSQKPGHGIRQLRDPDLEQLWQSDGTQPHRITIEFGRRTAVTHVSLWLNVRRDDSYTPTKVLVEAGTDYHDLTEVRYRQWDSDLAMATADGQPLPAEPHGWKHFYLSAAPARSNMVEENLTEEQQKQLFGEEKRLEPIWTWMIQISVLANHQNGKDTHVRGCLVWGPKEKQRAGPVHQQQHGSSVGDGAVRVAAAATVGEDESMADEEDDDEQEDGNSDAATHGSQRNESLFRSLR